MEGIEVEKEAGIQTIWLDDPETKNSINLDKLRNLGRLFNQADEDEDTRVAILASAVDGVFCSGGNIKDFKEYSPANMRKFQHTMEKLEYAIEHNKIPIIAAVDGFALGGGTEISLCCDFVIASENAKFGQPEINLGILPGMGGVQRLMKHVNFLKAKELVMTGEQISGSDAESIGLVNKCVPSDQLMNEVKELAEKLASQPAMALWHAKLQMNYSRGVNLMTSLIMEKMATDILFDTSDKEEGMQAFIEKRKPEFKSKWSFE